MLPLQLPLKYYTVPCPRRDCRISVSFPNRFSLFCMCKNSLLLFKCARLFFHVFCSVFLSLPGVGLCWC